MEENKITCSHCGAEITDDDYSSEFVSNITDTELIQYLKERNLYINEMVEETEEY